jgi:hypothetical protein
MSEDTMFIKARFCGRGMAQSKLRHIASNAGRSSGSSMVISARRR